MGSDATPTISIIIPTLNEAEGIASLLDFLKRQSTDRVIEIIVVDGGSTDQTAAIAKTHGATVLAAPQGRGVQMNCGAAVAQGDILYFLHADTYPQKGFDTHILNALTPNSEAGCFQMRFSGKSLFLQFFAWFTRFNWLACRGGDQSLFISKQLFQQLGGYDEAYTVYEDVEFISRLYKATHFRVLPQKVITSSRKYQQKGVLRLQYHFAAIHIKKWLGASPQQLWQYYQRHIGS